MEKIGHRYVVQYFYLKGLHPTNIKAELDSTLEMLTCGNLHAVRPTILQREFSVNMWAGMIDGVLVDPVVLPPRLNW
ncbi:unnamed protein product [Euphydryas editha]|uniref:Uncharacterized protein n=1 Tax=Euphydryas editha TaxID=104508 RepID=A0AAU9TS55_EUPED|nr:unnamed protein product [Euphydryas editha]